jgi:Phage tail assembly chaperone protein
LGNGGKTMIIHVHYRASDGEIFGWETGSVSVERRDGMQIATFELNTPPDAERQRIVAGELVEKTGPPPPPSDDELKRAVFAALSASDNYAMPDRDDLSSDERQQWLAYRRILRGLKAFEPADRIAAWPIDPRGNDAIARFRNRKNK